MWWSTIEKGIEWYLLVKRGVKERRRPVEEMQLFHDDRRNEALSESVKGMAFEELRVVEVCFVRLFHV